MSGLKAMVVEDSLPNQNILNLTLQKMGFEVESFGNGEEAWTVLQARPTEWAFILSDIMMPKMDGLNLLMNIRNHDILKTVPVYLITAMSDKNYVIEAKKHNVTGYILKPISYAKILSKIQPMYPDKKFPQPA